MLTQLTLKRAPEAVGEAVAWFLPGEDPREWLATVASWDVATQACVFYPIADASGATPLGALVVPPAGTRPAGGGRVQGYRMVTTGFYLPVDAVLFPAVEPAELGALKRHAVLVWHPVAGLSGFDEVDARRAWNLVLPPETLDERWNLACAVEPTPGRMGRVRLAVVLSPDDLFGEESKDIGSEPISELPIPGGQSKFSVPGKVMEGALIAGALGLKGLMAALALVPRGAGPETWVNHLEKWAGKKLRGANADLERERHRELHRLMEMLERDPVNALKHAISLADLAKRGSAAASARLGERSMDFNLKRLGGGGAADSWDVPPDIRTSLATRYRQAAQREAGQGNFRRAACIFAELLGDFAAAADMLKRGRFFLEAATLYRERLHNEMAAAESLAEGGYWDEAIAIHERAGRWLEVAKLQENAGRPEAARAAVRRAVMTLISTGDVLAAAKLLETRLDAGDEALALLADAWPDGKQALGCLEERVALLGRRHAHPAIRELLAELTETRLPATRVASLVGLLAGWSENLVDAGNRRAAAEAVRVQVSGALATKRLDGADEIAVLRALTRLEPQDRLLKRDVLRFREERGRPVPAEAQSLLPGISPTAFVRKVVPGKGSPISLPRVGRWLKITADEREIHAVARTANGNLFFTRGTWAGAMQSADWPDAEASGQLVLARIDARILLMRSFARPFEDRMLSTSDAFGGVGLRVGSAPWLPTDVVAASAARTVLWVVRVVGERVVLASYAMDEQVYSRDVTDELTAVGAASGGGVLCLEAKGGDGRVAMSFGRHLLVMDGARAAEVRDLGAQILALVPAPPARSGWVALLERGAVFVDAFDLCVSTLDGDAETPRGVFLGDGRFVMVGRTEGRVFAILPEAVAATEWFAFEGAEMVAITRAAHPREFVAFDAQGAGQRWQLTG